MEHLLVELIVVLLVAGLIFYVVKVLVTHLALPGFIIAITGAVLAVFVVIYLIRLLPALVSGAG